MKAPHTFPLKNLMLVGAVAAAGILGLSMSGTMGSSAGVCRKDLRAITWNVAAVNNNPFEYWITHDDPAYNTLIDGVQDFIDNPGARDVAVGDLITDGMIKELFEDFAKKGWGSQLPEVEKKWASDYKDRKIISGFLKDKALGKKRLTSMPDRVTNTIRTADGSLAMRPTVINCVEGDMSNMPSWWKQWRDFMFNTKITVPGRKGGAPVEQVPSEMLQPIMKSKYPDITEEEQAISIPLQTVCLAIFDAILVHMLNTVAASTWQPIRADVCNALNKNKDAQILSILTNVYADADVVFLQETAHEFVSKLRNDKTLGARYSVLAPDTGTSQRDQNSLILVSNEVFDASSAVEVSGEVLKTLKDGVAGLGDLLVSTINAKEGRRYLLASFHGDTNGLSTLPVVEGVHKLASAHYAEHTFLMGLDANTYKEHSDKYQGVTHFQEFLTANKMVSCWGATPNPLNPTTCNARTYLQPQLNKAIARKDKLSKGDINLKDWIIFGAEQLSASETTKDNTGKKAYTEEMVFPTMHFPSDHAVVATLLAPVSGGKCLA
mmetsp:Transcript_13349/g.32435  ORF Transcript_13349/g.32435 Transcript_13349/m.32435 type:complete len:549 (-) Transcript_13349:292-1938(-)